MLDLARGAADLGVARTGHLPGGNAPEWECKEGLDRRRLGNPPEAGRPVHGGVAAKQGPTMCPLESPAA